MNENTGPRYLSKENVGADLEAKYREKVVLSFVDKLLLSPESTNAGNGHLIGQRECVRRCR